MCENWNSKIVTIPFYKNILNHLGITKIPNDIYLFRTEKIIEPKEILEKFYYLCDFPCIIKDTPIDTLLINMNRLTPAKISSFHNKLKEVCINFPDDPRGSKLTILDSLFKYEFKTEELSDDKKKYYNPWTKMNYTCVDNFKYKCRSLRIVSNSEREFYHYLLSEYNNIDDFDENLSELISKRERVNLDTISAITLEELRRLKYYNEDVGIGTNYKKLYDRLLPFIESINKPKKVRKALSKGLKTDLWDKYYPGKLIGPCYVCSKDIDARNFEAGHVMPVAKGGSDKIDNLRPICRKCNGSMSDTDLYEYKKRYYTCQNIDDWVEIKIDSPEKSENPRKNSIDDKVLEKYTNSLFFHKLYRVRLRDINDSYKEFCKNENISFSSKSLESMLSVQGCEKITDTHVYYSGVCIQQPSGMNELDKNSFVKLTSGYKDNTRILRDLQRRNANLKDLSLLLTLDIPSSIKSEIQKLIPQF